MIRKTLLNITMEAFVTRKPITTGDYSCIEVRELPVPVPEEKDILVAIKAVATNPIDTKVLGGARKAPASAENPVLVGWDGAGVVEEVGSQVTKFKKGDEVYFAGSIARSGCFADFCAVDERVVGLKPNKFTFSEAASAPLTTITAWEAIVKLIGVPIPKDEQSKQQNAAKKILIVGGAGGVGSIATQISKYLLNLQVIATASREITQQWCKDNGADIVIDHNKSIIEQLKQYDIQGVDYILCCSAVTVNYFNQFIEISVPFGRIAFITANPNSDKDNVNLAGLMGKSLTISGEYMFTRPTTGVDIEYQHEILTHAADLFDKGILKATKNYDYPFTLQGIQEALALQYSGKAI